MTDHNPRERWCPVNTMEQGKGSCLCGPLGLARADEREQKMAAADIAFLDAVAAREELERLRALADALAGALDLMLHDAHPVYGNTTGWRGGIGGAALTWGCSVIDPPPGAEWAQMDLLSTALREYIAEYPLDLDAVKAREKERAMSMLNPKGADDA